jgi:type III pantothenate kinase
MILTLDVGNTRVKWGLYESGRRRDAGALPLRDMDRLEACVPKKPSCAVFANVAGVQAGAKLQALFQRLGIAHREVVSVGEQCGVVNTYRVPAQLGADRWAALIGARALGVGTAVVVMAGTATTVDLLDANGVFQGGVILPGLDLMRTSLSQNTAQLGPEPGEFVDLPRSTTDAIASGCISAQLGVIERAFRRVADEHDPLCILSGGGAQPLFERLDLPKRLEPHLVLDGLARIGVATWPGE